jgi:hypothetical protein
MIFVLEEKEYYLTLKTSIGSELIKYISSSSLGD